MEDLKLYTVKEVAEILDLHVETVRRHIKQGDLKAAKIGRAYRILEKDLKDYIMNNKAE